MAKIQFTERAFKDLNDWRHADLDTFDKIMALIRDISRDSFKGLGKPEPLKGNFKGCWSRRISLEHRLIYEVQAGNILIIACHGHYE